MLFYNINILFSRKTPNSLLPEAQIYNYSHKRQLVAPSSVRWGTIHSMISSILNSVEAIIQVLRDPRVQQKPVLSGYSNDLLNFFTNKENIQKVTEVESLLRPISSTIKMIEGENLNSSEAYFKAISSLDVVFSQADLIPALGIEVSKRIKEVRGL